MSRSAYPYLVRAVLLEVPQSMIDERRRSGADRWDEMWEGELHMSPPPSFAHNRMGRCLVTGLDAVAAVHGLEVTYETGLWAADGGPESYRIPDVSVVHPDRISQRGMETGTAPLLAIEIRSSGDEAYLKIPFYGRVGVTELVIIDATTEVIRRYVGNGLTMTEVSDPAGPSVRLETLPGVSISLITNQPGIRVECG